jgi:chromosome segregation ATPase
MKRLSKAQAATKSELAGKLREKVEALEAEITEFNERRQKDFDDTVGRRVAELNEVLAECRDLKEEVSGEQESYYDERSEKWQEGDAGSAYSDWKDAWDGLDMDDVDEPTVQEVEMPDVPDAQEFDDLPDAPE